ncbi:MAG: EAL domain-containing protein [Lachnospiraceae bacterium]|jgi:diguanylate cyclase (GGDEF)-like protein|nr:EAL domain-containing protein [Lachnospiraceae bacterium]
MEKYGSLTPEEKVFSELIDEYTLELPERLTLESKEDFIYLSDLETYEMYLISATDPSEIEMSWKGYEGQKCYQVLQKRESPCPFCTNYRLEKGTDYIWRHHNELLDQDFILKDRLVEWKGKTVRMETVISIKDEERVESVLWRTLNSQNLLNACSCYLIEGVSLVESCQAIARKVQEFYNAHHCVVVSFGTDPVYVKEEAGKLYPVLREAGKHPEALLREWYQKLRDGRMVLVKEADESLRKKLGDEELLSFCTVPVSAEGKVIGLIGLYNIKSNWSEIALLTLLAGQMSGFMARLELEQEKRRIKYFDRITGYLNFEGYREQVNHILETRKGERYTLWYSDLKNFKYINDVFGYDVGDQLIRYEAEYLKASLVEGESFCRISADNFSVLKKYESQEEIQGFFDNLVKKLQEFGPIKARKYKLDLVCGVYLVDNPGDELSLDEMINRANMAQKYIKSKAGSQVAIFDDEMRRRVVRELQLEAGMKDALKKEEFVLYMQPQVPMRREKRIRAEVLVRWKKEDGSILMPGEFIGLFERDGLIVDLDRYVFEHACSYLREWLDRGCNHGIAVNISRMSMLTPGFVEEYSSIKKKYGIPDGLIELEFTENVVVENLKSFMEITVELQKNGFRCAMDDFGTSQSSLNVLKTLPLDVLKLDRLFFQSEDFERERGRAVVDCVVQMARVLHMTTVAEGVEGHRQVEELAEMGCDYIQGFIFAKPMPAEDFCGWVRRQKQP